MKLWMVKFYIKKIVVEEKPITKTGFLGIKETEYIEEWKTEEKEIHSYIVDSEEKADFLIEAFTSTGTSAKKIELEG